MSKIRPGTKRARAMRRRADGTFAPWRGGITKGKYSTFHGTMVHIGAEFRKQHGRAARIGEAVRTKNNDGSYNKNAEWYVKTENGWRKARTKKQKPSRVQVRRIRKISRKGRGKA